MRQRYETSCSQILQGGLGFRGSMYPIIRYLGFGVRVIIVQVLGNYMIIRYVDPEVFSGVVLVVSFVF